MGLVSSIAFGCPEKPEITFPFIGKVGLKSSGPDVHYAGKDLVKPPFKHVCIVNEGS